MNEQSGGRLVAWLPEVALTSELWNGADVRWTGRPRTRADVRIEPGDRAVVIDAGRHHLGSFGSTAHGRPSRRRGVLVRLTNGSELPVPARHLEVVAPDHPLRPAADGSLADWWLGGLDTWTGARTVGGFVPRSLPAVGVVPHEREGELDVALARALVDVLCDATSTPDDVFFAVWTGWGDTPPARFPGSAVLDTPGRSHFLLRGPLEGAMTSISASPAGSRAVSGIWWPADRAWLLHTEVDFSWTFVAGSSEVIKRLAASPQRDVRLTTHDASPMDVNPERDD